MLPMVLFFSNQKSAFTVPLYMSPKMKVFFNRFLLQQTLGEEVQNSLKGWALSTFEFFHGPDSFPTDRHELKNHGSTNWGQSSRGDI
jgi:hypothetical protein